MTATMVGVRVLPATRASKAGATAAAVVMNTIWLGLIVSQIVTAFSIITNTNIARCRPTTPTTILAVISKRRINMERRRSVLMMTEVFEENDCDDDKVEGEQDQEISKRRFEPQQGDDSDFYRDLERAKIDKLGVDIPPEQARQSAIQAEQDFLAAMKEVSKEFQEAKEELGSDGAVDLFLNRIRKEDEEEGEGNDQKDENDDEENDNFGVFQ